MLQNLSLETACGLWVGDKNFWSKVEIYPSPLTKCIVFSTDTFLNPIVNWYLEGFHGKKLLTATDEMSQQKMT